MNEQYTIVNMLPFGPKFDQSAVLSFDGRRYQLALETRAVDKLASPHPDPSLRENVSI